MNWIRERGAEIHTEALTTPRDLPGYAALVMVSAVVVDPDLDDAS